MVLAGAMKAHSSRTSYRDGATDETSDINGKKSSPYRLSEKPVKTDDEEQALIRWLR